MLNKNTQRYTFLIFLTCLLSLTSCEQKKTTEQILAEEMAKHNDWLRQQNEQLMQVQHHPHGGYIFGILVFALLASPGVFLLIIFLFKPIREGLITVWLERRQSYRPPIPAPRVEYEDADFEEVSSKQKRPSNSKPESPIDKAAEEIERLQKYKEKFKADHGEQEGQQMSAELFRRMVQQDDDNIY